MKTPPPDGGGVFIEGSGSTGSERF
jgi:hypothetical protein